VVPREVVLLALVPLAAALQAVALRVAVHLVTVLLEVAVHRLGKGPARATKMPVGVWAIVLA